MLNVAENSRLKFIKNWFQLSAGLNLGTNHIWAASQIQAAAQIL